MAIDTQNLWDKYNGKGFSAKHAEYAERASTDVMGHDLTLTMTDNQVTAIGGKPISAIAPAEMTGATASTDGESGLVPAPDAGDQDKYLKGDGTWESVPLEKSTYGTYVSSEQGEAVQGEGGEIEVSENSVELYDTFKGVKFGAARAVADREGNVIDETYATREGATPSEAGLMSAADKSKLDGITDYVVSAEVSGSTLTLTPKTGSAVAFTASGEANVIESVKLGNDTLTPTSKVVTIPMLSSTTNGAVTAPAAANRNHYSFLDGMGDWSMLAEVAESDIDGMFLSVTIGGREYKYVIIGNQEWLAENLDYKFLVNGSQIQIGQSGSPSSPAAWYYDNAEATYGIDGTYKCGLLYNWHAAKYLDDNKATLLPSGWHVPSNSDFNTLVNELAGYAGTKLKALDNSVTSSWPSSWNGTDNYGFKALPGGYYNGSFNSLGTLNYFWTTTDDGDEYFAYSRYVSNSSGSLFQYNLYKTYGYSIRLVKDII